MKRKIWATAIASLMVLAMTVTALPVQVFSGIIGKTAVVNADENDSFVEIGTDDTDNMSESFYIPVTGFSKYGFSEQIYTAEEIGSDVTSIDGIAFYLTTGRSFTMSGKVYLLDTEKTQFDDFADSVAVNDDMLVYEGPFMTDAIGWMVLPFSKTFSHNPDMNLMVIVENTTGDNSTHYPYFRTFAGSEGCSIYYNYSSYVPEPGENWSYEQLASKNCIRLYSEVSMCTLTYDPNNGVGEIVERNVPAGGRTIIEKQQYTRDGYTYARWNTEADGSGTYYDVGEVISVDSDIVLYAKWTEETMAGVIEVGSQETTTEYWPITSYFKYSFSEQIYTAGEIGNCGTIEAISFKLVDTIQSPRSGEIYLLDTEKEGFSNATDFVSTEGATKVFDGVFPFGEAGWTKIEFETLYTHDKDMNLMVIVIDHTGSYESNHRSFACYYVQPAEGNALYSSVSSYTDSGEVRPAGTSTTSAQITNVKNVIRLHPARENAVVVTYKANGSGENDITYIASAGDITLRPNSYTWENYTFTGWNTAADGSGEGYSDEETISVSEDLVLYAQWQKDPTVTVTFLANDGSERYFTQEVVVNKAVALNSEIFTRNGYDFLSWNTDPSGNGTNYAPGQEVTLGAELILYAQWYDLEGTIEIGSQTTTSTTFPIYASYKFSFTEQIYSAEEVGDCNTIEAISFKLLSDVTKAPRSGEVYLLDTEKEVFSNGTDIVSLEGATKVFDGVFPFDKAGWTKIEFETLYTHDKDKNLMVVVIDHTGSCENNIKFACYRVISADGNTDTTCSILSASDSVAVYPGKIVGGSTPTSANKNVIRLHPARENAVVVTYKSNGSGENDDGFIASVGEVALHPNLFTREDYTFTGWNTEADGSGIGYTDGETVTITGDLVLYAQWQKDPCHTITFFANDGSERFFTQDVSVNKTRALVSKVFTQNGYEFVSWNTNPNGNGTNYVPGQEVTLDSDLTLYAKWNDLDGLTQIGFDATTSKFFPTNTYYKYSFTEQIYTTEEIGDCQTIEAISFKLIDKIQAPRSGEIYLLDTEKEVFSSRSDIVSLEGATKVFDGVFPFGEAGWTKIEFETLYTHDKDKNLMLIVIDHTGYYESSRNFSCYEVKPTDENTNTDCSLYTISDSVAVYPGNTAGQTTAVTNVKNVIRLHPVRENAVVVTYKANGSGENDDGFIASVGEVELKPNSFTREDYTFIGWNTAADGSGIGYTDGETITVTEDLVLFAQWQKNPAVTVTFFANDGSERYFTQEVFVNKTGALDSEKYSRTGYVFLSWNTDPSGEGTTYMPGQEITLDTDLNLYAKWEYLGKGVMHISGETLTSATLPIHPLYNNSYSEQIYTADEIGDCGTIEAIAFKLLSDISNTPRSGEVYLLDTQKTGFSDDTDVVSLDGATKVFEGEFPFGEAGWTKIEFDTPFTHVSGMNLMVIVIDHNEVWESGIKFECYEGTNDNSYCSLYSYNDIYAVFPGDTYGATTLTKNQKNVIRLYTLPKNMGSALEGMTISLDGDIGVNLYMDLAPETVNSSTANLQIVLPNGNKTSTVNIPVSEAVPKEYNDKIYYVFKCSVSAKDMTSAISVKLVDGDEEGTEYTFSVKTYAEYILDHSDDYDEDTVSLVKALLNYGAMAQTYFGVNTEDLANSILAADEQTMFSGVDADAIEPYISSEIDLPDGVTFVGATLSLKSETTLSLYFTSDIDAELEFTCEGKTVEVVKTSEYTIARIRGINAKELLGYFTVTITAGETGGEVTYSAMTYCYNVLNGNYEENLQNVCKALFQYGYVANGNNE